MIRLLHTESSMALGGQELRVLSEIDGLAAHGFSSALAAPPGSRILADARARGIETYAVGMRGSFDPAAVAAFMRIIKSGGFDMINAHGSKDGWSVGFAARLLGKKIVRSRHVANPIRKHIMGRLVYGPLCDLIVTTSESIRQGMIDGGVRAEKIVSVPTGVDTDIFHPGVPKGGFRAELDIEPAAPLVGMVSVLRGDKGPDVFVRAAEIILGSRPDARFVLVGDGWMRRKLEATISGSRRPGGIMLAGYRRDVPNVLADLDVFVLPAKVPEGVPQAVLQAHAMKVPVVASDVGGINEVAVDGKTAITVPPGDAEKLAEAIVRTLTDRDTAKSFAEAGYELVTKRYTLPGMLNRMSKIYGGLCGK